MQARIVPLQNALTELLEAEKTLNKSHSADYSFDLPAIREELENVASSGDVIEKARAINEKIKAARLTLQEKGLLNENGKILIEEKKLALLEFLEANRPTDNDSPEYVKAFQNATKTLFDMHSGFNENLVLLTGFCEISENSVNNMAQKIQENKYNTEKTKVMSSSETIIIHNAESGKDPDRLYTESLSTLWENYKKNALALQETLGELEQKHAAEQAEKHAFAQRNIASQQLKKFRDLRRSLKLTTLKPGDEKIDARDKRKHRDETIGKYQFAIQQTKKEQRKLIKKLHKAFNQLKNERDFLKTPRPESNENLEQEVKFHFATPDNTFYTVFSANLEQPDSTDKIKFKRNVTEGFSSDESGKLKTGLLERLFDSTPSHALAMLYEMESRKILLDCNLDLDDPVWLKQNLKEFLIDDFTKIARSTILTNSGELRPEFIVLLDNHSDNVKYHQLSKENQEKVKNCLIFSLAHAGISHIVTDYANNILNDPNKVTKYQSFQQSVSIPELINETMKSSQDVQMHVGFASSLSASLFGSPRVQEDKKQLVPHPHDTAFQLTELCKKTLKESRTQQQAGVQNEMMNNYFHQVNRYILDRIFSFSTPKERAIELSFWVNVAKESLRNGDFHTFMAVQSAVLSEPVAQLKNTHSLLENNIQQWLSNKNSILPVTLQTETLKKIETNKLDVIPFHGQAPDLKPEIAAKYEAAFKKVCDNMKSTASPTTLQNEITRVPLENFIEYEAKLIQKAKQLEPVAQQPSRRLG